MDHAPYDKRRYPIVGVRQGYGEWARTYEQTVQDEMDLRLLERLRTVDWAAPRDVLDLARRRNVYRTLRLADVTQTGLADASYDL